MGRLQAATTQHEVRALLHASVEKLGFKRRAAAVAPARYKSGAQERTPHEF